MRIKHSIMWGRTIIITLCSIYFVGNIEYAFAETRHFNASSANISAAQQQTTRKQIQKTISTAKQSFHSQDYATALRMLYDAYYQERQARLSIGAYHEISEIVSFFLKKPSPLMKYLQDTQVSIFERIDLLNKLKELAYETDQSKIARSFQLPYQGILVDIVLSSKLTTAEKTEILTLIEHSIKEGWVNPTQKSQLIQEMQQNQTLADQQFQTSNYVEAFRLLAEADSIHGILMLGSHESTVAYQYVLYVMDFARNTQSPLLNLLRGSEVSLSEKRIILDELKGLASQTFQDETSVMFRDKYSGPLIKIMTTPKLTTTYKLRILGYIQEAVEKEFSSFP